MPRSPPPLVVCDGWKRWNCIRLPYRRCTTASLIFHILVGSLSCVSCRNSTSKTNGTSFSSFGISTKTTLTSLLVHLLGLSVQPAIIQQEETGYYTVRVTSLPYFLQFAISYQIVRHPSFSNLSISLHMCCETRAGACGIKCWTGIFINASKVALRQATNSVYYHDQGDSWNSFQ